MKSGISVIADLGYDSKGEPAIWIKISAEQYELNVLVRKEEAGLFSKVKDANWDERGSLKIGTCANASAFWSCRDDEVSVAVGHDAETWDFAVTFPTSVIEDILSELRAL